MSSDDVDFRGEVIGHVAAAALFQLPEPFQDRAERPSTRPYYQAVDTENKS